MNSYFWTQNQIELLKQAYSGNPQAGLTTAQQLLPDKPRAAIAVKACRLKITTPKPRQPK